MGFFGEVLSAIFGGSGFAALPTDWRQVIMLAIACLLLYMGIGVGILAYMLLNLSLKHLEAGIVSLFGNLIPVFTLIFAYVLLGERLNVPQVLCVALALSGVVISSTEKKS